MSGEGDFSVLNRAEARSGLLTVFDDARDEAAKESAIARLAPHERERFQRMIDEAAEQAGLNNGRIARHSSDNSATRLAESRKASAKDAALMTALQIMLADPVYRALYDKTADMLDQYERAAAIAMMNAERALDQAEQELAETLDQAARLPDGTRVFMSENGTVFKEDGNMVDPDIAAGVIGLDDAPSYEAYLAHKKAVADAEATIDAIRIYQVDTLGGARERFEDHDNPPSADDLRDIQDNIETNAPLSVQAEASVAPPEINSSDATVRTASAALPQLGASS